MKKIIPIFMVVALTLGIVISITPTVEASAPSAITDLICESSIQAGAIWLRWTTPSGNITSYEVRHSLGVITEDSFNNPLLTSPITQALTVTPAGSVNQELIIGLNPNTRYFFSIRAMNNAYASAVSSPAGTSCVAPARAPAATDTIAPTTRITAPVEGSIVLAGQPIRITGRTIDAGGSSVQRVEISLDGGVTWRPVIITGNVLGDIIWEHTLANATAGTIEIRTRATDWVNNVETSSPITITVSADIPAVSPAPDVTAPRDPVVTPPSPSIALTSARRAEIQTQIQIVRAEIISLLTQLIAILQAQFTR